MVATSAHHVVRVTVRVSVASTHRDIDVTLPTASTLAEVLPELARMIDIPQVHRPWEATTVAGAPLDMHTPLHKLRLFDGSVITFHPIEPPSAPVVRDAAESLSAAAEGTGEARGLDVLAGVVGAVGIAGIASRFASLPVALAACAMVVLVVAAVSRSRVLYGFVPAITALAVGAFVAGPRATWMGPGDLAVAAMSGAFAALTTMAAGAVVRLVGPALAAAYCTAAVVVSVAALGAWLPDRDAPAALAVLAGLVTVMAIPGVASRAAGLQIPRIPTAGEEFTGSDGYQLDVDARSANAIAIADAMAIAVAICTIPAFAVISWHADGRVGWVSAFALTAAGAMGLHASRHHYPASRVALTLTTLAALCALFGAVIVAQDPHPVLIVLAVLLLLGISTTPLWAPHLPTLEPTTVVWFERAEAAAIMAVIPLAVQLTGLFGLIRGL